MKRIFMTAAAILGLITLRAQTATDTTGFAARKLKVEEINIVSSYYSQNGNNAAVTGGIGSQKLTDIATSFDIKLTRYDLKQRKHSFTGELGIDHYTSASSDRVDLKANSSASHADTRIYPSLTWEMENEKKGSTVGAGLSFSTEFDYQSLGLSISGSKKSADRSAEFSAKLQAYLDKVSLVIPVELRTSPTDENYPKTNRNTYAASISFSKIINKNFQVALLADLTEQKGFLSMPFYRVYFSNMSVHQEKLPDSRTKIPIGIRANYFAGDKVIIRAYYRYYSDNWGITAHTASLELPIKVTPFFSISPFYRYYTQTATKYFAPYAVHTSADEFYTSNYDLSAFNSSYVGANFRIAPPTGVFGAKHLSAMELRYGHYSKNIDLSSNVVTVSLKFK